MFQTPRPRGRRGMLHELPQPPQLDVLGTNRPNVTRNVEKWQLDSEGRRRMYQGRNRDQYAVGHDHHLHPPLDVLHENGVHAVALTTDSFEEFMDENEFVFIDFFAPWCLWCQRLEPTWEKFAEEVEQQGVPIRVAKVGPLRVLTSFRSHTWRGEGATGLVIVCLTAKCQPTGPPPS